MSKGIVLAGGLGSRLFPLTYGVSKQLLPVYDKPMIYYPISTLLYAGITEILIISSAKDLPSYIKLLGNGSDFGVKFFYKEQPQPNGIAESFIIGKDFIGDDNVCLILGDNIFYGDKFNGLLEVANINLENEKCSIFGVEVNNPKEFGVIEFDEAKNIKKIVEKPLFTNSNTIVSGLYFYTNDVVKIAQSLSYSDRGELEISDINNLYLKKNKLNLIKIGSDISWTDTGTYNSLLKASNFFQELENKNSKKIACIEEISLELGLIDKKKFNKICNRMKHSDYGRYLINKIIHENN